MESKDIRELIELIGRSNFATFEMEREGFRLKLVKEPQPAEATPAPAQLPQAAAPSTPLTPQLEVQTELDEGLVELTSPIVGTYYTAPSPEAPPFVEIGSRVKKGQVLCIVEAMKVMNEIESEMDAEVVQMPVKNGQPVEYGEVLFHLRPLA